MHSYLIEECNNKMIDNKNVIKTVANGCEVTLLFNKEPNQEAWQEFSCYALLNMLHC